MTENQEKEKSELELLSNKIGQLEATLKLFENDFLQLHSNLFNEPTLGEDSKVEEAPKNKISEMTSEIELCMDIQRRIRLVFDEFNNLLVLNKK